MMPIEFRPIAGFEELYKISNYGHILSMARTWIGANGCIRTHDEMTIRPAMNKRGYLTCILCKNGIRKPFLVHRLVALHFVDNPHPEIFDEVNHKNGDKAYNYFENLEWADTLSNMRHAFATGLNKPIDMKGKFNEDHHSSKPLFQMTKSGEIVKEWPSLKEVQRQLGHYPADISRVCLGKRKTAHGFRWQYK